MQQDNLYTLHGLLWEFRLTLEELAEDEDTISAIVQVSDAVEKYMREEYTGSEEF